MRKSRQISTLSNLNSCISEASEFASNTCTFSGPLLCHAKFEIVPNDSIIVHYVPEKDVYRIEIDLSAIQDGRNIIFNACIGTSYAQR